MLAPMRSQHPRGTDARSLRSLALAGVCFLAGGCAGMDTGRRTPVTPQRPTFSSSAFTTAAGTLEVEAGLAIDPGDRLGTPTTLKVGLDDVSEGFVGFEPIVVVDGSESGLGDFVVGYRRRFAEGDGHGPALAWLAALKIPPADEDDGLGSGETDVFGALSATWAGAEFTSTGYLQLGLLGDPGGGSAFQMAGAWALGLPLRDELSAFGELTAVLTPEFDDEQLFGIAGIAWASAPGLVFDVGVQVGLSDDAPDFKLLVGTTSNLGTYTDG